MYAIPSNKDVLNFRNSQVKVNHFPEHSVKLPRCIIKKKIAELVDTTSLPSENTTPLFLEPLWRLYVFGVMIAASRSRLWANIKPELDQHGQLRESLRIVY